MSLLLFALSACAATATSLCLAGERFRVFTRFRKSDGTLALGQTVPFTADSGSFWFFGADNIEVNVKVLDGCAVNGRYWVFASGGTNVEVQVVVVDTKTGTQKVYDRPAGPLFATLADTNAFATCP